MVLNLKLEFMLDFLLLFVPKLDCILFVLLGKLLSTSLFPVVVKYEYAMFK